MKTSIKTITIQVSEEEHKQIKVAAAKEGKTLKQIFMEAIAHLMEAQQETKWLRPINSPEWCANTKPGLTESLRWR